MKIPDMSKLENLLTFIIIYVSCVNFDTIIISIETKMLGKLTKLRVLHLGDLCPAHHLKHLRYLHLVRALELPDSMQ